MTTLIYNIDINASKAKTWAVLADFANLHWTQTVKKVRYTNEKRGNVGMARHCDLSDGGYIVERITQWNEGNGYTYAIDDARDPVTPNSYVVWSLSGDDRQSKVTFEVNYQLKYGILGAIMNRLIAKKKFSKQIALFMGELKTHMEKQC